MKAILMLLFITSSLGAQTITEGEIPPPGTERGISFPTQYGRITITEKYSEWFMTAPTGMIQASCVYNVHTSGEWRISDSQAEDILTAESLYTSDGRTGDYLGLGTMDRIRRWYRRGEKSFLKL